MAGSPDRTASVAVIPAFVEAGAVEMQVRAAEAGLRIREVPLPHGRCTHSKVAGNLRGTHRASARLIAVLVRFRCTHGESQAYPT